MASTRNEWSLQTVLMISGAAGVLVLLILMAIAGYGFWASLLWGVIVAVIVALVLMYWARGQAAGHGADAGSGTAARTAAPAAPAAPQPAPQPEAAAAPEPKAAPEPQAEPEPAPEPEAPSAPEAARADTGDAATSGTPEGPAVKPSKPLPGQAELAAQKGSWKYQSEGAAGDASAETPAPAPAAAAAPAADADQPAMLDAPRDGGPDDLKMIKGVGPKLEQLLHQLGVYHFDQIAGWSAGEVAWVDQNLKGFKGRVSRDNWVEQAATLAEGGATEFSQRVKKGDVY